MSAPKVSVRKGKRAWRSKIHETKEPPRVRKPTQQELDEFDELFESQIDDGYKPGEQDNDVF